MPLPITEEMLRYMLDKGYLVVAEDQECSLKEQDEILYDFGKIPPESEPAARDMYFTWYREASEFQLVNGEVYRRRHNRPKRRRR